MAGHMVKYHLLLPLGVAVVALALGVPLGTAVAVGMMTGCMSMVFMMGAGHSDNEEKDEKTHPRHAGSR